MIQYLILSIQLMEKYLELQLKVQKIFQKLFPPQTTHMLVTDDVVHQGGQRQDSPNLQEAEHWGPSQPRDSVVGDGQPSPLKKRRKIYKLEW